MPLTPDEEKRYREEIRKKLEEREKKASDQKESITKAKQAQLEERLRAKIKEEEEENFYRDRGLVKYKNRHGEMEWITPEEAERRKNSRRKQKRRPSSRTARKKKRIKTIVINTGLVIIVLGVLGFLYKFNPARGKTTGRLLVHSDIPGAAIYLDGTRLKSFTPDTLAKVETGRHYLTVHKPGFTAEPPMQTVFVRKKGVASAGFKLKNNPEIGYVKLEVNARNFRLYVDGLAAPLEGADAARVPVGYHTFMIVKKGFIVEPAFRRLLVAAGDTTVLRFDLVSDAEIGYLQVSNNLFRGNIYLNRNYSGMQATGNLLPVRSGSYEVRVRQNGYRCEPDSQFVHINPGETRLVIFRMEEVAKINPVQIWTRQPGACIILDGEFLPVVTPVKDLKVSSGNHFVNFIRDTVLYSAADQELSQHRVGEAAYYFDF